MDDFTSGMIGGAVGASMAGRRRSTGEVATLWRHDVLYVGGHPFVTAPDRALKPSRLVVREDGVECLRLDTRRFLVPVAECRGASFRRHRRRIAQDEWFVTLAFQHGDQHHEVVCRLSGFGLEEAAQGFVTAVNALVEYNRQGG